MATIIYETKTGKPFSVDHVVDAKEAVKNGSYTFTPPAPPAPPAPPVKEKKEKTETGMFPKKMKLAKETKTLKKPIRK